MRKEGNVIELARLRASWSMTRQPPRNAQLLWGTVRVDKYGTPMCFLPPSPKRLH